MTVEIMILNFNWLWTWQVTITTVRDTKLDMCKEHYLLVMKITEPHIGHTLFLSAMGLKESICTKRDSTCMHTQQSYNMYKAHHSRQIDDWWLFWCRPHPSVYDWYTADFHSLAQKYRVYEYTETILCSKFYCVS